MEPENRFVARAAAPLLLMLLLMSAACLATAAAPSNLDWLERSNAMARQVLEDRARFFPEGPSATGDERYDTAIADLGPGIHERQLAQTKKRLAALLRLQAAERDPRVRQDLAILIDSRRRGIDSQVLWHRHLLDVYRPSGLVNFGLSTLLRPSNRPERQARALVRLKRYAGLEKGYRPVAVLARQRTEEQLARRGLTAPYVEAIRRQLANTPIYLQDLGEQFARAKLTGWQQDFAVLSRQLLDYDDWLRRTVLPRARAEPRPPRAIYADMLRDHGVDATPEDLIQRAGFDFQELREQMQLLARQVAAARQLPSGDYRDVIRVLKSAQVGEEGLLPLYRRRLQDIEAVIRREKLVSLPAREALIRLATPSEAAVSAVPQMQVPRLVGNTGERGEFLIPIANPHARSGEPLDDFAYDAVAWTLTAHEARPGHELQFASMIENGVSLARAVFAFNAANVEGWGLYAEALLLPYMPAEAQLVSLQWRLLRVARAFLDPMVNLGLMQPEDAKRFLMQEVVMSEPFSQQEIDRYAFESPGQATSYYYGYARLLEQRTRAEIALGKAFDLMAFNDFVLAQGLLPPRILQQALEQDFIATRRGR